MKTSISKFFDRAAVAVSAIAGACLPILTLSILLGGQAGAQSDVWRVGDVFVAVNNGQYQVLRPTGTGKNSFTIVDTLSDGTGNSTAQCTFDSNWRPHTTSFGTLAANPSSLLERYQVGDVHTSHLVVAKAQTAAGGTGGKSVAIDALGNVYVAHSGGNGEITAFSPPAAGQAFTGTPLSFANINGLAAPPSLLVPTGGAVSDGLDVTSSPVLTSSLAGSAHPLITNSLYFTSGTSIYFATFTLQFNGTTYVVTSVPAPQAVTIDYSGFNPNKIVYHGIKIVAGSDGSPVGLIAAGEAKLLQFVLGTPTTARLVAVYDASGGKPNWQNLTLDPCAGAAGCPVYSAPGSSFWATDEAGKQLAHFSIPASLPGSGYVSKTPDFAYSLSTAPRGVCEVGGVGAGQPRPAMLAHNLTNTPTGSTFTYPVPNPFPANFYNPAQPAPNTFTVGALFSDTRAHTVSTKLFSVDFDPSMNAGVADDGARCLATAPPPPIQSLSPYCEAYKLELNPTPGTSYSLMDLDLFTLQQTTSANATPPAAPGPEPLGTNPKFYHDMRADETIALLQDETRIKSGSRSTVFTIQSQTAGEGFSCGYSSPIVPGGVYNVGQNLTFKFQAVPFGSSCSSGPFLTNLLPRLTLVLENPNNNASSTQKPVSTTGCSSQCLNGFYDLNSANSSWQIQVKTSQLPAGKYIVTTFDDSGNIPEFSYEITLQ